MTRPALGVLAAAGVSAALVLHYVVFGGAWWLNAGQRIPPTLATVAIGSAIAARSWSHAAAFAGGVLAGKVGILMLALGGGNIFPIVIGVAAAMIAAAAFWGGVVGLAIRRLVSTVRARRAARDE